MNFVTALIALAIVILGGYYVFYVITPSERDSIITEYGQKTSGVENVFKSGVENMTDLLPPR